VTAVRGRAGAGAGTVSLSRGRAGPARRDAVSLLSCYLILLMAIPATLVVGSLGQAGAPAALLAIAMLPCYLLARVHPAGGLDTGRQPVRAAAVVFACSILAAYISASRAAMPAAQVSGADRGLLLLAGWLGVLFTAADGIDRADRLGALLGRVVAGGAAMAALGVAEFGTGVNLAQYITLPGLTAHLQLTDLMNRDGLSRVMATASQPLELAAVLAMILPVAIHRARFAPAGRARRRWLEAGVIGAALPLTVSRSAIFVLAVIAVVLLPTWPRRDRRRAGLVLLGIPVVAWLAAPGLLAGLGTVFGQLGTDQSSRSRSSAISSAAPFIAHHPWFGQGFQTFFPQTFFFVDDQYLTSLIETGIIGTAALIGLFAAGWVAARQARARSADPQARDLAQSLAASVAGAAVFFASFDALSFSIASGLFFLLLGCTGAMWRLTGPGR
jgi:O-antigen ligase